MFICYRETSNLYPFILEHFRSKLIYVLLGIDVTVMPGSTFRAYPFPDTQILNIRILDSSSAGTKPEGIILLPDCRDFSGNEHQVVTGNINRQGTNVHSIHPFFRECVG